MSIDWEYLTDCHNHQNGTAYKAPKNMLKSLYAKHETCEKVAKALLVSRMSIYVKMRSENLRLKPKGWRGTPRGEILLTAFIRKTGASMVKNMTCKEIAFTIGLSTMYVGALLRRVGAIHKKQRARKKEVLLINGTNT